MRHRDAVNAYRYRPDSPGHYESYFQRANHPQRPLAFWIRYTVFVPKNRPEAAVGELWAIYFDGERGGTIAAAKQVVPLGACSFSNSGLKAQIGSSSLDDSSLVGSAQGAQHQLSWNLRYHSDAAPLLLFPERLYETRLPKAKTLVGSPFAHFHGELNVNGASIAIDDWVGSQNHNWGSRHTDQYAWGQVAGFDHAPDVFLECATARVKLGPVLSPRMSPAVVRIGAREIRFATVLQSLRAEARYGRFHWSLKTQSPEAQLEAEFDAPAASFIALPYDNPPGGQKICLNSKLAGCRMRLRFQDGTQLSFSTRHRAAFEILGDEAAPNVVGLS